MKTVYHPANKRGGSHHGWLKSKHSFSFADYYSPDRVGFGALKVINDDHIEGGHGVGAHSHRNMEIITIPLAGALIHEDDIGNKGTIHAGDIQVMSAGTGVVHSEINASQDIPVKLLQIWLESNQRDVTPRYQRVSLVELLKPNRFNQVLSPNTHDAGVWVHQNAWFSVGEFDKGITQNYLLNHLDNGVYVFVIFGSVVIDGKVLQPRDGLGITGIADSETVCIEVIDQAQLLLMEIPIS